MVITYHGDNYFKIQSSDLTVLIDPTNERSFRGATLILNTLKPALTEPTEAGGYFWIDHQGEYEIKDLRVQGWSAGEEKGKEKTIYRLAIDGLKIAIFGYLSGEPEASVYEHLQGAAVMIIPAGGKPFIAEEAAAKIIRQIEPAVVIPSLFKNLNSFLKEFNKTKCDLEEKLVLKSKDLKPGAMEIKCLK